MNLTTEVLRQDTLCLVVVQTSLIMNAIAVFITLPPPEPHTQMIVLDMTEHILLEIIKAHTRYDVKCECGEYLLKRGYGLMSSRDQWELHMAEVLMKEIR